jgi:hypothetical protein
MTQAESPHGRVRILGPAETPRDRLSRRIIQECTKRMKEAKSLDEFIFWHRVADLGSTADDLDSLKWWELNWKSYVSSYLHNDSFKKEAQNAAQAIYGLSPKLHALGENKRQIHVAIDTTSDYNNYHVLARFPAGIQVEDKIFTEKPIRQARSTYVYFSPQGSCAREPCKHLSESGSISIDTLATMDNLWDDGFRTQSHTLHYGEFAFTQEGTRMRSQEYAYAYLLVGVLGHMRGENFRMRLNDFENFQMPFEGQ